MGGGAGEGQAGWHRQAAAPHAGQPSGAHTHTAQGELEEERATDRLRLRRRPPHEAVGEATDLRYPLLQMRTVKNNKILRLQTRAARDP